MHAHAHVALAVHLVIAGAGGLDADPAFKQGRKFYDELEYEQAVFRFQEVALRPSLAPNDKASALIWLGLSYAGTGDFESAQRAFVDGLRANPSATLPVEPSARLAKLFAEAKEAAKAAGPAATPVAGADPLKPEDGDGTKRIDAVDAGTGNGTDAGGGGSIILAGVGAATGAVFVVAGVGLGVLCALSYAEASAPDAIQLEAKAALDNANLALTGASVLVPMGAAVAGASTWFLLAGGAAAPASTATNAE